MESHNANKQDMDNQDDDEGFPINPAIIGWGLAALIVAFISVNYNSSAMALAAGFFTKCLAVIVGTGLGTLGALIGDAVRKFAHPDAVYTSGGMLSLIWIKVFWALGPQVIGLIVGTLLGASIIMKLAFG